MTEDSSAKPANSDQSSDSSSQDGFSYERSPCYCIEIGEVSCSRRELSAEELRQEMKSSEQRRGEKLIIIHGLPVSYVEVLRDEAGLEAAFVEALARRLRLTYPSRGQAMSFEYPELVRYRTCPWDRDASSMVSGNGWRLNGDSKLIDALEDSPRYAIPNTEYEVLLCRASLWHGKQALSGGYSQYSSFQPELTLIVLFLDRPLWHDPSSSLSIKRYKTTVTKHVNGGENTWEFCPRWSSTIANFEYQLWEHIQTLRTDMDLIPTIQKIALGLWTELFEMFTTELQTTILRHFQRSIDRNLDTAASLPDKIHATKLPAAASSQLGSWKLLSKRVEMRIRLAHMLSPRAPRSEVSDQRKDSRVTRTRKPHQEEYSSAGNFRSAMPSKEGEISKSNKQDDEEDNQAVNRLIYLCGILAPFSIVSGILSMGEPFGPKGGMFHIYWAITVPLAIVTFLIIRLDTIRRQKWSLPVSHEPDAFSSTGSLLRLNRFHWLLSRPLRPDLDPEHGFSAIPEAEWVECAPPTCTSADFTRPCSYDSFVDVPAATVFKDPCELSPL